MTETLFYFAYGANMSSEVFQRRRGLRPVSAEAARLEGWRLVFDEPGIRFVEPVFAGISRRADERVHGVLYRLSGAQLERLNRTEGAGYELIHLPVDGEKSGAVEAWVYRSKTPCSGRKPSKTYLQKLLRGAREHGLPAAYIDALRQVNTIHLPIVSFVVDKIVWLALRYTASAGRIDNSFVKFGASVREGLGEGQTGDSPATGFPATTARGADSPAALLAVRRVTRAFDEGEKRREVLAGVDFHLERGERLALLGRSGSGKSTLLNLIAGIDRPDHGEIEMDGVNLTRLSEHARTLFRRRHIGFIYQFFNLIATLSVAENIALPLQLTATPANLIEPQTLEMLERVGLAGRGDDYPDQLSGGEQQRVAIARALVHRPSLVLADEPTGSLDAESGRRALELLTGLSDEARQTLLIVTHSLEVAHSAGRVIVLDGGKVDAGGDFRW